MPQFELEDVGSQTVSGLVRARTAEQAVARAAASEVAAVLLVDADDPAGWMDVHVGGEPSGRVREHNRMRFRRD